MKVPQWLVSREEIVKICASKYSKNALPGLFLHFFVKHFPNYLILHYKTLFFVDDFQKIYVMIQIKKLYPYKPARAGK